MIKRRIVIATRKSPLALRQSAEIKARLQAAHPTLAVDMLPMITSGDERVASLTDVGGKGLFVKELEAALLDSRADFAVHSMKDVPMQLPPELCLAAICEREDARDVFISNEYASLLALPHEARVGTASLRRKMQLLALRGDLMVEDVRGNIETRLKKLDQGDFAALVLAAAGLQRLGLTSRIRAYFAVDDCLPAAGQGALALQCRRDDEATLHLIAPLNHPATAACVTAERALCACLEGGCAVPIGAYATAHHHELSLRGLVAGKKGIRVLRAKWQGSLNDATAIGEKVAEQLLAQGAAKILQSFYE